MTRLLLIIVLLTQMGCSVVQTAAGTFIGTLSADVAKDELEEDDDSKK
tara:strand:+ start:280 stop:423 length:144 start_codon:yes stop_codon:yes gene_type:complete